MTKVWRWTARQETMRESWKRRGDVVFQPRRFHFILHKRPNIHFLQILEEALKVSLFADRVE